MAREFSLKILFPEADTNTLYFSDFNDIINNKFGAAYSIVSDSPETKENKIKLDAFLEKTQEIIRAIKENFAENMEVFFKETEEYSIDPKIRKLAEACYKNGMFLDWTDRNRSEKFYRQIRYANHLGKQRLERLKAGN